MLRLYYDLMSQPSRAAYIFLNKFNIPFQKCPVNLAKAEHKTDEFKAINPFQLVPVIDDNGFKLTESVAIFRYVCRKYKSQIPDHWYPENIESQARVDEYLAWQHLNTRLNCAMYFQTKFLIPILTNSEPNEKRVAGFQNRMETALDAIENIWLKDKKFIAGDQISIADLFAACELDQPSMAGYDVYKDHPTMRAWHDRVRKELNPYYDDATKFVYKIREKRAGFPPPSKL